MKAQKALDSQINSAHCERRCSSTIPDFLLHCRDIVIRKRTLCRHRNRDIGQGDRIETSRVRACTS